MANLIEGGFLSLSPVEESLTVDSRRGAHGGGGLGLAFGLDNLDPPGRDEAEACSHSTLCSGPLHLLFIRGFYDSLKFKKLKFSLLKFHIYNLIS